WCSFFFSSRRRHTRSKRDWSSDVCSSDLHAVYPVAQELKSRLLLALLQRDDVPQALVFTRTKHRANRLAQFLDRHRVPCERIHGNRSQPQRTQALAGFKAGRLRVLVATDI